MSVPVQLSIMYTDVVALWDGAVMSAVAQCFL